MRAYNMAQAAIEVGIEQDKQIGMSFGMYQQPAFYKLMVQDFAKESERLTMKQEQWDIDAKFRNSAIGVVVLF